MQRLTGGVVGDYDYGRIFIICIVSFYLIKLTLV